MNKWARLARGLSQLREALEIVRELYTAEPQIRALLGSRVPFLGPGTFSMVDAALTEILVKAQLLALDEGKK